VRFGRPLRLSKQERSVSVDDRHNQVGLHQLLLQGLKDLPSAPRALTGLVQLARLKPEQPGSIGQVLQTWARERPQATALRFEDEAWTYAQFNAWANRIAHVLRQEGVVAGDAVAILMENRPLVLACVAATVKLGAVAAMLNPQQRGDMLAYSLRLTRPKLALVGGECAPAWLSAKADLPAFWDGEGTPAEAPLLSPRLALAAADNPPGVETIPAHQPCFYIFTSGTTGLPKASKMTHYRWLRGMVGMGRLGLRMRADDRLYCCLPLYHNNALTVSWGAVLSAGATLVLARRFSARQFWDELRRHDATVFCYIGELCRYLLNQPPQPSDREHRIHTVVGNGLRPELWDAFQQRFGIERISEFYGASESNLAFVNAFNVPRTAGYCPMPFAVVAFDGETESAVRDGSGRLRKVARGEVGLLITEVGEKTPFDGYTDAKASEAKLLREVFAPGDCWFNTGDLVRDQGWRHIQFVDRVGDTFRWKGENVATTEVEGVLTRYPGVEQAVVYGVEIPGCDGRAGMAALTLTGDLEGLELSDFLAGALPAYAVPLFLRLRKDQATTATFKYRKVDLKREGFDPDRVRDPLYVRWQAQTGYLPLTPERHAAILRGEWRG
jgi:acyl-CoA synthetase (AMP-forming)/AMP-acid ligase II